MAPGWRENAWSPRLPSFLAREMANSIFAVFDCPYALHLLYLSPFYMIVSNDFMIKRRESLQRNWGHPSGWAPGGGHCWKR